MPAGILNPKDNAGATAAWPSHVMIGAAAQAVGANGVGHIADSALLKRFFSKSSATTLFVQAVTAWNSASVDLSFATSKRF